MLSPLAAGPRENTLPSCARCRDTLESTQPTLLTSPPASSDSQSDSFHLHTSAHISGARTACHHSAKVSLVTRSYGREISATFTGSMRHCEYTTTAELSPIRATSTRS